MRVLCLSLFFAVLFGVADAATIHVPQDQPTIQAGIDAAQAGDIVLVACGTYYEHDIVMKSGVHLRGETGVAGCATVDAEKLGRVISCVGVDAAAAIEGLVLTGGWVEGYGFESRGGAILLSNSSPTVARCVIQDNAAEAGGGGIFAVRSASTIENCLFARNSGCDGAGIYADYASPRIAGCTFHDNDALFWGGAIFCENESSPLVVNCTLVRNHAYQGGGIWCVNDSDARLENCLIAFSAEGEGIYAYPDYGHESDITVACCDVFGNDTADYGGTIGDQTGMNGNISADPVFCDPANDDFRLAGSSPCLPENNECGILMGANGPGCETVGIGESALRSGDREMLWSAPNPFTRETMIAFRLANGSPVALVIFDLTGRRVRNLTRGMPFSAGVHEVRWDGLDDDGRPLASGIYLCRFENGVSAATHAVTLLR